MLEVKDVRELRALAEMFRDADRETQRAMRKASAQVAPILKQAAHAAGASTRCPGRSPRRGR